MAEFLDDPLEPKHGHTLTPFHLLTLLAATICLVLTCIPLPPALSAPVHMFKRVTFLLVCLMIGHHLVTAQVDKSQKDLDAAHRQERARYDPLIKGKIDKKPNDWEFASAHPSHFLTTRDGKPRLFPFPLGLAGGDQDTANKTLWWEAGNSAHVGHYNQRETPEAREQLRLEVEAKEESRQKAAKKRMKEYEGARKRWQKRLTHLKILSAIVILGIFQRRMAVFALAAAIYYIVAMEIKSMLAVKAKDDDDKPAKKRRKIPTTPGMGMTYLYEPNGRSVAPSMAVPTKAPTHRLMTSLDSRYAS
ncbi:hypothetical protein IAU60_001350 [Kwoniella sp. DSM 27419]